MNSILRTLGLVLCAVVVATAQTPRPPAQPAPTPLEGTRPALPTAPAGVANPSPAGSPSPVQPSGSGVQTSAPDQDLSQVPLLTSGSRPVPPAATTTRLGVTGDAVLSLSLNDAIRRALENNRNIEVARDNVRLNETNLRALEGIYDPVFQFSPLVNSTVSPTTSVLSGASNSGSFSQTDILLSPSLTKNFSNGGQYQVFFNDLRRTSSSPFTLLSPFYASNLGVTFAQPLWRNRAVDLNRRNIRIQRKRLSQSDAQFRQQTIDVISQVQQAYWELVYAIRDQQNKLTTVNLAREQLRLIEARITGGIGAPLERAEAETQIATANTNLLAATQYVTVTENALKQLLLPNPSATEWSASILPLDQPLLEVTAVDLPAALAEARSNRPELNLLRMQQEINHIDLGYYRNQIKPRVDLQATFSVTGLAGHVVNPSGALASGAVSSSASSLTVGTGTVPIPSPVALNQLTIIPGIGTNPGVVTFPGTAILSTPGVGTLPGAGNTPGSGGTNGASTGTGSGVGPVTGALSGPTLTVPGSVVGGVGQQLRNLFSFGTRNVAVGLTIEIPVHNKSARANLAGAHVQEQQLAALAEETAQAIEADVRNSAQTVEITRRQVVSARAARESAEVQLAGERKLYQTGLSTTFLVFQRENQLSAAVDAELRAETDYSKAVALLQHATSTTLHANNVIVENVTEP